MIQLPDLLIEMEVGLLQNISILAERFVAVKRMNEWFALIPRRNRLNVVKNIQGKKLCFQ